jgi:RHS repeat-associated protein
LKQYGYNYDLDGNRTGEQIGTTTNASIAISQSSHNNLNQVTSRTTSSGQLQFAGSLDKQGTVTVNDVAATMNHFTTNFVGYASVTSGTNTVPIIATDYGNHSRTNKYQLVVTNNGVAETISYDLNGNETNVVTATSTNSYQWDALNRLASISGPTNKSLFAYDGLGRRVQDIEMTNGVAYVTNKFLWDGMAMAEQRDNTGGTVVKRFFGEGEQINGTSYYFTRDHLGSVREMTDSTGAMKARYDYDPYGRQTKLSGTMDADFGYAGMFLHQPSGLNLTLYRAYTADLGRWLSRDPSGETGGLNLYAYVLNNPINAVDFFGLWSWTSVGAIALGVVITAAAVAAAPEILTAVAVSAVVGGVLGGVTAPSGHVLQGIVAGAVGGAAGAAIPSRYLPSVRCRRNNRA